MRPSPAAMPIHGRGAPGTHPPQAQSVASGARVIHARLKLLVQTSELGFAWVDFLVDPGCGITSIPRTLAEKRSILIPTESLFRKPPKGAEERSQGRQPLGNSRATHPTPSCGPRRRNLRQSRRLRRRVGWIPGRAPSPGADATGYVRSPLRGFRNRLYGYGVLEGTELAFPPICRARDHPPPPRE